MKTGSLSGCPEGLKSKVEHVAVSSFVYHRDLGTSVGPYISTHQLFLSLFADRLTGSREWDEERHLSELYTGLQKLHKQPNNRWRMLKMCPVCFEALILKCVLHTALWHVPHGSGKWSLHRGSVRLIFIVKHLLLSILMRDITDDERTSPTYVLF